MFIENSVASGALPRKSALVTEPLASEPTFVGLMLIAPLPAMMPATCVPWPSVSVESFGMTRVGPAGPPAAVPVAVKSGCVASMPVSFTATSTFKPVKPSQSLVLPEVVSGETPSVTRDKSFAATRWCAGSKICTPGSCASAVQSAGASTRSTGPNAERSRPMIFAPSFSRINSVAGASAAKRPRFNAVPGGNGSCATARPSSDGCNL